MDNVLVRRPGRSDTVTRGRAKRGHHHAEPARSGRVTTEWGPDVTAMSLGDLIDSARRDGFVGRHAELASFDAAVAGRPAGRVLFVSGPGGIGKTTLLLEMRARARAAGRTVALLDGWEVDPSPDGFRDALRAGGAGPWPGPLDRGLRSAAPGGDPATVILVDGYEQLGALDGWLRAELIPALRAGDVMVLAGREPPAAAWRTDPGWRRIVAVHRLDYLDDAESADLLTRAGVGEPARAKLLRLGKGHPLALALLADAAAAGTVPERLADVPDLIAALMENLLREAPSDAHMTGLATCAKVWLTTEDLLRETVGPDAPTVFAWLRQRPFVVSRPRGLTPHDLTREVLDAEFERRSPERYRALHRIIHDHVVTGIRQTSGVDQQLLAQQLMYLHRYSPLTAVNNSLRARGSAAVVPARADDRGPALALIDRFEGPESAALAEGWFADQPDGLSVVRGEDGIAGFALHIRCPSGSVMEDRDPVVRAVLDYVDGAAPLRPGESIDITRFVTGRTEHQRDPYAVLAGPVSSIMLWCTRPFAWSFVTVIDAEFWGPEFEYLGLQARLEVEAHGVRHVAYGIDWRRLPVDAWLDLMNEREHCGGTGPPPESMLRPPPLSRAAFGAAVRSALQHLGRPDRLAGNPLVGGALGDTPHEVRAAVEQAIDRLADEPKGDQLRSVLYRTYVRAAPTQEAAAEVLALPFSTYRRYLAKALDQVTDLLWSVEIGAVRLPREPVAGAGEQRLSTF
jgi:RecA/RadA recombinase